jgi:hypothetical protein
VIVRSMGPASCVGMPDEVHDGTCFGHPPSVRRRTIGRTIPIG